VKLDKYQGEEYKTLRAEIDRNSQITATVFLAAITATSALIGYGISSKLGPIFLSPFAIIIPSLFFISSQLESTTRIAAYIMVFFEADSEGLNWETRWLKIRQKGLLPHRRKYTFSLSGLYGALSAGCIMLAGFYWNMDWWMYGIAVGLIALLVLFGILSLNRAFSLKFCKQYVEAWTKLKQREQPD
jgi:fatty acid desaturase